MSRRIILLGVLAVVCFCAGALQAAEQGEIYGWGDSKLLNGETLTDIIQIAGGGDHSLALKSDGSIVGWGYNHYAQATAPEGNDYVAIAAGYGHNLALKSDGSIVGWGTISETPAGNDFIDIAAGDLHSLALKSDGSIVGWGNDEYSQATPPSGTDYVAIAAGRIHSLALKSDGSVIGWGYDNYGQAPPPAGKTASPTKNNSQPRGHCEVTFLILSGLFRHLPSVVL